jgi:hypothetical protein
MQHDKKENETGAIVQTKAHPLKRLVVGTHALPILHWFGLGIVFIGNPLAEKHLEQPKLPAQLSSQATVKRNPSQNRQKPGYRLASRLSN